MSKHVVRFLMIEQDDIKLVKPRLCAHRPPVGSAYMYVRADGEPVTDADFHEVDCCEVCWPEQQPIIDNRRAPA